MSNTFDALQYDTVITNYYLKQMDFQSNTLVILLIMKLILRVDWLYIGIPVYQSFT